MAASRSGSGNVKSQHPTFTERQGQYLAFIYYYTKVNGRAPSEKDMERYFRVSPPSVHQMVIALERRGLITRIPGQDRSIALCLSREQLPDLD
jgi:Mn-dependent DtxR family transcriptional regulator